MRSMDPPPERSMSVKKAGTKTQATADLHLLRTLKTHLFGEHVVVCDMRAIASAINLRTTATVAESNQTIFR